MAQCTQHVILVHVQGFGVAPSALNHGLASREMLHLPSAPKAKDTVEGLRLLSLPRTKYKNHYYMFYSSIYREPNRKDRRT